MNGTCYGKNQPNLQEPCRLEETLHQVCAEGGSVERHLAPVCCTTFLKNSPLCRVAAAATFITRFFRSLSFSFGPTHQRSATKPPFWCCCGVYVARS